MKAIKKRILCVDNRASRNLAIYLLEQADYEVTAANSISDALETAAAGHFDLYLLNHKLLNKKEGEIDGLVRAAGPHTPVLFYSTNIYPFHMRRLVGRGAKVKTEERVVAVTEVAKAVSRLLSSHTQDAAFAAAVPRARRKFSAASKILAGAGLGLAMVTLIAGRHLIHQPAGAVKASGTE